MSVRGGVHIVFLVLHVMPHCTGFTHLRKLPVGLLGASVWGVRVSECDSGQFAIAHESMHALVMLHWVLWGWCINTLSICALKEVYLVV